MSDADFSIDFPVGTFVDDLRERQNYITREGGKRRLIRDSESHVDYETLLQTDEGQAVGFRPTTRRNWLIVINVSILLLIIVTYKLRRIAKTTIS